jgi:hypothetical protein
MFELLSKNQPTHESHATLVKRIDQLFSTMRQTTVVLNELLMMF